MEEVGVEHKEVPGPEGGGQVGEVEGRVEIGRINLSQEHERFVKAGGGFG